MELLLNLYLGHLLGDFVLQPGVLVAAKRKGLPGLLTHVGIIGAVTAAILWADLAALWNIVLLAVAAHLLIEVITIRLRLSGRASGLSVFLIDQGLHSLSLVLLVWLASPLADVEHVRTLGMDVSPSWVALACSFVAVTFLGSIFVFEVVNAFGPRSKQRDILPYDAGRIVGMVERGGSLLAATLLPASLGIVDPLAPVAFLVFAFIPRALYSLSQPAEDRAYQMLLAAAGLCICALSLAFVAGVTLLTTT